MASAPQIRSRAWSAIGIQSGAIRTKIQQIRNRNPSLRCVRVEPGRQQRLPVRKQKTEKRQGRSRLTGNRPFARSLGF